jgi:hypothetical protein
MPEVQVKSAQGAVEAKDGNGEGSHGKEKTGCGGVETMEGINDEICGSCSMEDEQKLKNCTCRRILRLRAEESARLGLKQ